MLQLEIPSDFWCFKANEPHVKLGEVGDPPGLADLDIDPNKIPWDRTGICSYIYLIKNDAFMIHGSVNIPGKLHGLFGYGKALICFFKNPQQQKTQGKVDHENLGKPEKRVADITLVEAARGRMAGGLVVGLLLFRTTWHLWTCRCQGGMSSKISYGKLGFFCEHLNMMNKAQQREPWKYQTWRTYDKPRIWKIWQDMIRYTVDLIRFA